LKFKSSSNPAELDRLSDHNEDTESLVRRLEATGDYKVLRRLVPRQPTSQPASPGDKIGVIVDFETTGLDFAKDEIIEAAMLKFSYSGCGAVTGVTGIFQAFNQPAAPIPIEVIELTGITDEMVAGHEIDTATLEAFVSDANIVIAHAAVFDRRFAERSWDIFQHKHWACSATGIDWQKHGFSGAKLTYLLTESGFFHDAHRALDDCYATLEILAGRLPATSATALGALLDRARRKTFRVWAEAAPFHFKDTLKRRRYRWNDGTDGGPRSWCVEVDEADFDAELDYVRKKLYQRDADINYREITALDRFSNRV
jgi:DNA polymerase-3 subunit epsilon